MTAQVLTICIGALVVLGIIGGYFQSRYAKKIGGQTRSVRRAETIAGSPFLEDLVEQHGNLSDVVNYRAAHRIADVVAGAVDQPNGAGEEMEQFDMLDPHYRKPEQPS